MHDRRKLREGIKAKLIADVGAELGGRVYAGRLSALDTTWEMPAILVDVARSQAVLMDPHSSALRRAFEATVTILVTGPDTDVADLDESYADLLDELAVLVEWSLSRSEVLYDKLGIKLVDWLFVDDVATAKGPARPGLLASLSLRFHAVVVHEDGRPTS